MLDFEKIQKKANLAKELVSKGIAVDLEEAYEMIENGGLVDAPEENSKFFKNINLGKSKIKESLKKKASNEKSQKTSSSKTSTEQDYKIEVLNEKLIRLQERVSHLNKHIENLQAFFDTNLQAIENRLKELEQKIADSGKTKSIPENDVKDSEEIKESVNENLNANEKREHNEEPKTDSNISIQNIFNNSHNRLV